MGGGSAQVNPPYQVSVAEGLTALLGDRVTVIDGVEVRTRPVPARGGFLTDPETGEPGITSDAATTPTATSSRNGTRRRRHLWSGWTTTSRHRPRRVGCRAGSTGRGPVELGVDRRRRLAGPRRRARSDTSCGRPATSIGEEILAPPARTDVVDVGDGRSSRSTSTPARRRTPDAAGRRRRVRPDRAGRAPDRSGRGHRRGSRAAAAAADVAVVVVGLTEEQETESVDKSTLRLPGAQDALVEAVAAAAQRTVVVVNAATPVIMPWLDEVDAVLWAGLPGQEGGHAVAAALLGDIEPAGRLVTTFPADDGARRPGRSPRSTAMWSTTRAPPSATAATSPARPRRPAFWLGPRPRLPTWEYIRRTAVGAPAIPPGTGHGHHPNTGPGPAARSSRSTSGPAEPDQPVGWSAGRRPRRRAAPRRPYVVPTGPPAVAQLGRGRPTPGSRLAGRRRIADRPRARRHPGLDRPAVNRQDRCVPSRVSCTGLSGRRTRPPTRPARACRSPAARPTPPAPGRRTPRTRSPGLAHSTAAFVASISSSTTSICLTLAPSACAFLGALHDQPGSLAGARPRSRTSSRTMIRSKCLAASSRGRSCPDPGGRRRWR